MCARGIAGAAEIQDSSLIARGTPFCSCRWTPVNPAGRSVQFAGAIHLGERDLERVIAALVWPHFSRGDEQLANRTGVKLLAVLKNAEDRLAFRAAASTRCGLMHRRHGGATRVVGQEIAEPFKRLKVGLERIQSGSRCLNLSVSISHRPLEVIEDVDELNQSCFSGLKL